MNDETLINVLAKRKVLDCGRTYFYHQNQNHKNAGRKLCRPSSQQCQGASASRLLQISLYAHHISKCEGLSFSSYRFKGTKPSAKERNTVKEYTIEKLS